MTVPVIPTTTPTQPATTRIQPTIQLACNFDSDRCNFYQDKSDDFNWKRMNGPTYTSGTGPSNDHTKGDFSGMYSLTACTNLLHRFCSSRSACYVVPSLITCVRNCTLFAVFG